MNYDLLLHLDLAEEARLRMALTNIKNYYSALEGQSFKVTVVANAGAVTLFTKEGPFAAEIQDALNKGVCFCICNNALQAHGVKPENLREGITVVPAGLVEIVHLQRAGFAYIKP